MSLSSAWNAAETALPAKGWIETGRYWGEHEWAGWYWAAACVDATEERGYVVSSLVARANAETLPEALLALAKLLTPVQPELTQSTNAPDNDPPSGGF